MSRRFPKDEPMSPDELRPADREILDVLSDGRATKGMLMDECELSQTSVYERLEVLEEADHIRLVHATTSLWELVDDPREK